jgi:nicotinate-nucleotide adenylyltransferase
VATRERIGLFGSAFDPPHLGHQAVLDAAFAQLQLSQVVVLPTGEAWHKPRPLSDAEHRLAMARLAFADQPRVQIDPREMQRSGPSYTIDTLLALKAEQPSAVWVLLIGADQAMAFDRWHRWQQLLALAEVHVATRPSALPSAASEAAPRSTSAAHPKSGLSPAHPASPQPAWPAGLKALPMPPVAISATQIRALAARGQPLDGLVAPAVAGYIAAHHLYQTP